jgi:hypothetical protein
MGNTRSRSAILIGLAAAVGAFASAAMMSAATAPTARADGFTDIVNSVDGALAAGQGAFTAATADFAAGEQLPGLAALFDGINDYALGVPESLAVQTVGSLTNEGYFGYMYSDLELQSFPGFDFSDAVTNAQTFVSSGETLWGLGGEALTNGVYGLAVYDDLAGADLAFVYSIEELLLGGAASF